MFAQNGVADGALKNFNGSAFKTMENELADFVKAGGNVRYDIRFSDFADSRPNRVNIEYSVNNDAGNLVHTRRARFTNEAGQQYTRMSRADIAVALAGQR